MSVEGLEAVILRNNFYFTNYRRLLLVNLLLFFVAIGLYAFTKYQKATRPTPKYVPTTTDGYYIRDPDVGKRHKNDEQVLLWFNDVLPKLHSFDFGNFGLNLNNDIKKFFIGDGHSKYIKAMRESNNLKAVSKEKAVSHLTVLESKVVGNMVANGHYGWMIEAKARIVYETSDKVLLNKVENVRATIFRVSTLDAPSGLAIYSVSW